jgi:hypothetical protein
MTSLVGFLQIYTLVISVIRFQGTVFTRGSSAKASVILLPYFPDQPLMKKKLFLLLLITTNSFAQTKALVAGPLIDVYGGKPLQNSVVIIESEFVKAIGTVGAIEKDFGTVSEGKYADIIAVKGDVLLHMALLQDVKFVVKKGKRYK